MAELSLSSLQTALDGKLATTATAATATKLATARTISLTGDVTGSATFDGSANMAITATIADDSHNHLIANVDGLQTALDGKSATSHTHSNYAGQVTASYALPATVGWYRIATSALDIGRNGGIFAVEWTASGCHGRAVFTAASNYGTDTGTGINQLAFANYTTAGITQARIVYNTTYSGSYAYVEVYLSSATAVTLNNTILDPIGWSLTSSSTAGSIPTGYTTKTLAFDQGIVSLEQITTAKNFVSTVATGTAPLVVSSTTVVPNLNADLLDGNQASAFSLTSHTHSTYAATSHTHTKAQITDFPTSLPANGGTATTANNIPTSDVGGNIWIA